MDHIVMSPYGLFVIETKNYKGWIFGSERQKQWTQTIYRQKHKFQNPIHQNYKHIKTLESLFADLVPPNVFISIVVFVGSAEFKSKLPKGVFLDRDWIEYIKTFQSEVISPDQLMMIHQRLEIASLEKSWKTNREHVKNLRQRKQP
nr:nuclease-related domain-containing protein [Acinetobacter wanghuae]